MIGAVPALIGALLIGAGLARQHAVARTVDPHAAMDPRLLWRLARQRSWLVGAGVANLGFLCIATGISTGRLSVVEPVAATQVLFALLFSARASGRRLHRPEFVAAVCALLGLAGFLVVAAPKHQAHPEQAVPWVVPIGMLLVVVAIGVVVCRALENTARGVVLAALAGLTFGTADALIKVMSNTVRDHGVPHLAGHWSLYAWSAAGLTAVLLQQSAYHTTHLGAAMPATATFGPTTATVLGAAMLGEQLRGGWAVPVEVVFFGLLLVGVARLAASPVLDDAPASDVDGRGVVDAEYLEGAAEAHVDGHAHREVEHLGIAED
jgi:drug/metabolite transporter (DMT)-like permease